MSHVGNIEVKRLEEELRIARSTNTRLLAEITGLRWLQGQHKQEEDALKKFKLQNRLLQEQVHQLNEQLLHVSNGTKGITADIEPFCEVVSADCESSVPRLDVGRLRLERSASSSTLARPGSKTANVLLLQTQEPSEQVPRLEADLAAARECIKQYELSANDLANEVERCRTQANEAAQQLLSSRLELARMKQQLWDANSKAEGAVREAEVLREQLKEVQVHGRQEQSHTDRYVVSLRQQMEAARSRADSEHQRALELEADMVVMRNKLASQTARIVAMSEEQHRANHMQQLHIKQLNDEVDELADVLEQTEERCSLAEEEVEQLRAALKVAQHAASTAQEQYEKLRHNLELLAVRRQQREQEQQAVQMELEALKEEHARVCQERDQLALRLDQLPVQATSGCDTAAPHPQHPDPDTTFSTNPMFSPLRCCSSAPATLPPTPLTPAASWPASFTTPRPRAADSRSGMPHSHPMIFTPLTPASVMFHRGAATPDPSHLAAAAAAQGGEALNPTPSARRALQPTVAPGTMAATATTAAGPTATTAAGPTATATIGSTADAVGSAAMPVAVPASTPAEPNPAQSQPTEPQPDQPDPGRAGQYSSRQALPRPDSLDQVSREFSNALSISGALAQALAEEEGEEASSAQPTATHASPLDTCQGHEGLRQHVPGALQQRRQQQQQQQQGSTAAAANAQASRASDAGPAAAAAAAGGGGALGLASWPVDIRESGTCSFASSLDLAAVDLGMLTADAESAAPVAVRPASGWDASGGAAGRARGPLHQGPFSALARDLAELDMATFTLE